MTDDGARRKRPVIVGAILLLLDLSLIFADCELLPERPTDPSTWLHSRMMRASTCAAQALGPVPFSSKPSATASRRRLDAATRSPRWFVLEARSTMPDQSGAVTPPMRMRVRTGVPFREASMASPGDRRPSTIAVLSRDWHRSVRPSTCRWPADRR
jgi:hypothetical protein